MPTIPGRPQVFSRLPRRWANLGIALGLASVLAIPLGQLALQGPEPSPTSNFQPPVTIAPPPKLPERLAVRRLAQGEVPDELKVAIVDDPARPAGERYLALRLLEGSADSRDDAVRRAESIALGTATTPAERTLAVNALRMLVDSPKALERCARSAQSGAVRRAAAILLARQRAAAKAG